MAKNKKSAKKAPPTTPKRAAKGRATTAKKGAKTAKRARGPGRAPARPKALAGTLGMVTLHVHDLQRAVAFYRDDLGFPVAGDILDIPAMGWAEIDVAPGIKLGLHQDNAGLEPGARAPGGASGFYFVVGDVDAVIEKLRAKGVKVSEDPTDRPYGRDAYVEDPSGNEIALLTPR